DYYCMIWYNNTWLF
nr:immunoglobulin light chain junction region [Macaca mulatta]